MADFALKSGEVRFVDFVTQEHMQRVVREIGSAGVDLGVFRDRERTRLHEVREMAGEGVGMHAALFDDERWRTPVQKLCAQVTEIGGAIKGRTPYGFCGFGLAINHPNHTPPIRTGPGSVSWPFPYIDKLLYIDEADLLSGRYAEPEYPLGTMTAALQYRERI